MRAKASANFPPPNFLTSSWSTKSLVVQHDAPDLRVEVAPVDRVDAAARAAVQEADRLALGVAALLVVDRVQLRDAQLALEVGLRLGEELVQLGLRSGLHAREASTRATPGQRFSWQHWSITTVAASSSTTSSPSATSTPYWSLSAK